MKNILVLVDFTETAEISVAQAIALAKQHGGHIHLCHIFGSGEMEEGISSGKFASYENLISEAGCTSQITSAEGDLVHEVNTIVQAISADIVVVGTHGKHGIMQNLFGSNIYNLVKRVPAPCLVVSNATKVKGEGFKKIMMPVGSHDNYLDEVKQACAVAADGATIVIFAINKPGIPMDEKILQNVDKAKAALEASGVNYEYLEIDSGVYSIGYSHETLEYLGKHDMDLIVIMTEVSDVNRHFGKIDKENVMLNAVGVPVLCSQ
jgi:nucleotide-binding universal stress UspA family protein